MDYYKRVVYSGAETLLPEEAAEWNQAAPEFARHNGKVNVLFRSGAVRSMFHTDINPVLYADEYWSP